MNGSILKELKNRAFQKEKELNENINSTNEDKEYIKNIIEFLKYEESFKKVSKSTVFSIFRFLGISSENLEMIYYNDLYEQLLNEINQVYTLVPEEQIRR